MLKEEPHCFQVQIDLNGGLDFAIFDEVVVMLAHLGLDVGYFAHVGGFVGVL